MLVVKEISRIILKLVEGVISLYNEHINGLILGANLVEQIGPVLFKIEEVFMTSTELDVKVLKYFCNNLCFYILLQREISSTTYT